MVKTNNSGEFIMSKLMVFSSVISAVLVANVASAFSLVGSSHSTWTLPTMPSPSTALSENNTRLSWGQIDSCGACTPFNNSLKLESVSINANPGSLFKLGNISYRNGTVWDAFSGSFGLNLNLLINNETEQFSFTFNTINTPNITGNPILDGDKLEFIAVPKTFENNGIEYLFQLAGFSQDKGITINKQFNAPEGITAYTGLYGMISETGVRRRIPEPKALLAFLPIGAYLLFTAKNRKRK